MLALIIYPFQAYRIFLAKATLNTRFLGKPFEQFTIALAVSFNCLDNELLLKLFSDQIFIKRVSGRQNNGPLASTQAQSGKIALNEPRCEKTSLRGFRPGPTQTRLYNHRRCQMFGISYLGRRGVVLSLQRKQRR